MHGFENVDAQADPRSWIRVLDRLRQEPFYRHLKSRVAGHIGFQASHRYLEVGVGAGDDARDAEQRHGCAVVGVDLAKTMALEARRRGLRSAVVATAQKLPFPRDVFDGCWAERLYQHLDDPALALCEMTRVLRPGGRLVVADPDYGTQTMQFPDQVLARRVLRFRSEVGIRNGTLAHRMAAMFRDTGELDHVIVESLTLIVDNPRSYDGVFGLRSWPRASMSQGWFSQMEVNRWETLFDLCESEKHFQWTVTFFLTVGNKRATA